MTKAVLYLGTDPSRFKSSKPLIHLPLIKIVPRPMSEIRPHLEQLKNYTHLIFTSRHAVALFFQCAPVLTGEVLAVGEATASRLREEGIVEMHVAREETQEGVIALLPLETWKRARVFHPRSSRARPALQEFFERENIAHTCIDLYDTVAEPPKTWPDFSAIDEIVFTSPSTVDAFLQFFGSLPQHIQLTPIGPITAASLHNLLTS